ncbi:MAG: murein biosynthesis integral membrane protein MurJ [Chloroflexi bacterium]|nr:murein biosynthesis integral membrane protein MurJ [Chloroflexota bacterium]
MSERRAIVTAAAIVMSGNVASRLLGIVREQVIAYHFGNTAATSAFVAATTVPTMVYDLLIGGAISAALVPVFSEHIAVGRDAELRQVAGTVMALVAVLLTGAALVLIALAPAVVGVLVPGLDPAVQEQAVGLTRLALPAVVFLGVSGVAAALLNARKTFTYPAFSGTMYNLGIIVAAVLFALSLGVTSLVVGVLIGAALHLGLQLSGLRRGMPVLCFNLRHPAVGRILRLYAPVALGLVVSQIGVVIDRNLASRTGDDSLAVLRFATTLVQFPVGMVVTATSTAILPTLSRQATLEPARRVADGRAQVGAVVPVDADADMAGRYTRTLVMGLRVALLMIIPLMVMMIIEREALVRLVFQRGAFSAIGTQRTALAFLFYAPRP